MTRFILVIALALIVSGCAGWTAAERQELTLGSLETGELAIEKVQEVAGNPFGVSDEAREYAELGCELFDIGSPFLSRAINVYVARHNAEAAEDEQIAPVTVDEFRSTLAGACDVVRAVLRDPGEAAPTTAPEPEPSPVA